MSQTLAPIQVKTIDHVTLIVGDLEQSRQFYVDILGMQEVERPAFGFPGLWFQAGGTQIHLILAHEGTGPAGFPNPADVRASRNHHFAFEVDDCLAATERLKEFGLAIAGGPQTRPDGPVQVYVNDPDGYVVELFSHPA